MGGAINKENKSDHIMETSYEKSKKEIDREQQGTLSSEWGQRKKKKSKRSRSRDKAGVKETKHGSDKVTRYPLSEMGTEKELDSRKRRHSPNDEKSRGETGEKRRRSREGRKRSRSREKRHESKKVDDKDGKKDERDGRKDQRGSNYVNSEPTKKRSVSKEKSSKDEKELRKKEKKEKKKKKEGKEDKSKEKKPKDKNESAKSEDRESSRSGRKSRIDSGISGISQKSPDQTVTWPVVPVSEKSGKGIKVTESPLSGESS